MGDHSKNIYVHALNLYAQVLYLCEYMYANALYMCGIIFIQFEQHMVVVELHIRVNFPGPSGCENIIYLYLLYVSVCV